MKDLKKALQEGIIKGTVNPNGYLCSFLDNVYGNDMKIEHQQMFDKGSGGELHSKAEAVHSSSMLGYNFFSWIEEKHPFVWKEVTYTKVFFEVQLRTLCCRSNPANMDIVLDGTDKDGKRVLLFIESKFLEYTNFDKMELSDSYLKPENYYGNPWNEVAKKLIEETKDTKHYNGGLKQSFCHLVALNALHNEKALAWFNTNNVLKIANINDVKIRFMNAIFCPSKDFDAEYEKYLDYSKHYEWFMDFIKNTKSYSVQPDFIKITKSYSVQPEWFNYSQIWQQMKSQIKEQERIDFLQRRYMNFADI